MRLKVGKSSLTRLAGQLVSSVRSGAQRAIPAVANIAQRVVGKLAKEERALVVVEQKNGPDFYGIYVHLVEETRFGSFDIKVGLLRGAKAMENAAKSASRAGRMLIDKKGNRRKGRGAGLPYVDVPIKLPRGQGLPGVAAFAGIGVKFRRVSVRSPGWAWWHPGFRGKDVFGLALRLPKFFDRVIPEVRRAYQEAYERDRNLLR